MAVTSGQLKNEKAVHIGRLFCLQTKEHTMRHSENVLSSKIRFFRSYVRKLSQEELALKIGISQAQLSRWERSIATPNPEELKRFSKELRVPLEADRG